MSGQIVSVIIPVYNRPWFLRRAVQSVLEQQYRWVELIVVDDGSDESTGEVIERLKKEAIVRNARWRNSFKTVRHFDNRGVSAARNTGIENASGQWIAFLDSDDAWLPEKLSCQLVQFQMRPSLCINQTEEKWIRKGTFVNPPERLKKEEGDLFAKSLEFCAISPSAVMMLRELFDDVGLFDESLPACEDYDMWLRVTCRYAVGLVRQTLLVKYGGHDDQLSFTVEALDLYRIQSIAKLLESGRLNAERKQMALDALERKCEIYAQGCRKRGREEEAEEISDLPRQMKERQP